MQVNVNTSTVSQLITETSNKNLTIKVNWKEKHFDITLFDGIETFCGTMAGDEIVKISNQLGITSDVYMTKCKIALTCNKGCENFIYELVDESFQWKQVNSKIKILFGSIQLTHAPVVETLNDIINVLVTNYHQLKDDGSRLCEEKVQLQNDNRKLLERIDEYVHMKSDTEYELYNQFLEVLNEKKKRISQLERLLKSNDIDVSNLPIEEEETSAEGTIMALYECDTEVETDNDATDNEKDEEEVKEKTEETSNEEPIDLDEPVVRRLPKRYNKKSDERKDQNTTESKHVDSKKSKKRINSDAKYEEAGPSGVKVTKKESFSSTTNYKNHEKVENVFSDKVTSNSKTNGVNDNGDRSKNSDEGNCLKHNQRTNDGLKNDRLSSQQVTILTETRSSVDDILAGLIA